MSIIMIVEKKEMFKRMLLISWMAVCLFLAGCAVMYKDLGGVYVTKGQYDQAILNFNKALEMNPKYAEAYCNRGGAYLGKGRYDMAILDFNKAIEINPNLA